MSSNEDVFPLDPVQDRKWTAPKLVIVGVLTLLGALAVIYTSATVMGEHRNSFNDLDHVR